VVAKARLDYSRMAGDAAFESLVQELDAACPTFRRLWRSPEVQGASRTPPASEQLTFEHSSYVVEGAPHLLLIFVPVGEEGSRQYAELVRMSA
jgi:hypothetical protein